MTCTVRGAIVELEREIGALCALVTDLRPVVLDDFGTQAAIRDLAERARVRELDVDVAIDLAYEQGRTPGRGTTERLRPQAPGTGIPSRRV